MSPELLKIINSFGLWVVALITVCTVSIQAGLFMKLHRVDTLGQARGALSGRSGRPLSDLVR